MTDEPDDPAPEPTEAEQELVRRRCLDAARAVVKSIQIDGTLERDTVTQLALQAMRAAITAWNTADIHGVDVEIGHVVATALWERIVWLEADDTFETAPYSAGGLVLEGYARAARLLEAYRDFEDKLDDDWDFGTAASFATQVLQALGDDDPEPA